MSKPIIECVSNFSEGRRPEIVEAISDAIAAVKGVDVLDYHSDADHNRTVITFVGSPQGVEEAAFRGIEKAAELIDMTRHSGKHPRIGATDVVPFVPVSGATMQDCVEMAQRLGQRVGDKLMIPVYLYAQAAVRPERRRLSDIRRGEYEKLKDVIATDPDRAPDYGPKEMGPAGATVIGAREFLIAYNVYLTSNDVSIAKKIARTVRHSSGGLRYVQAMGLLVEGQAQVSMNLTNFRKTPMPLVVETIRRQARRYGVAIEHSELVGLIPQDALVDAAAWYMQMDQFGSEQVLEQRQGGESASQRVNAVGYQHEEYGLSSTLPPQSSPEERRSYPLSPWERARVRARGPNNYEYGRFLDSLADTNPTPGGGSASAYAGAMAAGLVAMVARLTIGKKKYADVEDQIQAILDEAESLRAVLTEAVERDAAAFEAIMAAFEQPKDAPERDQIIQDAILHAAEVPLEVAHKAVRVLELTLQVATHGNINAITDAGTGAAVAQAALIGAGYNVQVNTQGLNNKTIAENMLNDLTTLEEKAAELQGQIKQQLVSRGGLLIT
ncbi:MAG: glutamate formimidoyltransferase [Chloroflexota bacterium]|nr:glutamate formimidoyltransferase [Chloroflexota bacterium]